MNYVEVFAACAGAIAVLMVGTWLVSLPLENVSIVDIVWGAGFVLIAPVPIIPSAPGSGRPRWTR